MQYDEERASGRFEKLYCIFAEDEVFHFLAEFEPFQLCDRQLLVLPGRVAAEQNVVFRVVQDDAARGLLRHAVKRVGNFHVDLLSGQVPFYLFPVLSGTQVRCYKPETREGIEYPQDLFRVAFSGALECKIKSRMHHHDQSILL